MALDVALRKRLLYLRITKTWSFTKIAHFMRQHEDIKFSPSTARNWANKFEKKGINYVLTSKRDQKKVRTKFSAEHLKFIDDKIRENPERSSVDLGAIHLISGGGLCEKKIVCFHFISKKMVCFHFISKKIVCCI